MEISVIICAYNAENTIKACLESVINQTFTNYEIVLINDGSTDKTLQIAQETLKNIPHSQIISQKNMKVSFSRNVGVKHSKAPIITFLDADDTLRENCLERLYSLMQQTQSDISCCTLNQRHIKSINTFNTIEALTDLVSEGHIQGYTCGKLFKKELFNGISFPENRVVCEDLAVMYKLVHKSRTVVTTSEPLYNYIYTRESLSNTSNVKVAEDAFFIRTERYLYYKNHQHIFTDWHKIVNHFSNQFYIMSMIAKKSEKLPQAIHFIESFYQSEKQFLSTKSKIKLKLHCLFSKMPRFLIMMAYKTKRILKFVFKIR